MSTAKAGKLFMSRAPGIMRQLMADFDLSVEEAAAILGNIGWECGGFRVFQEGNPLSGRGGWGWCQWTGPRRVQFEAYCARNNLDPSSDKANYGWLFIELSGSQGGTDIGAKRSVRAVKNATGLLGKVKAFELNFERAGVKHYDGRMMYAEAALVAFGANVPPPDIAPPKPDKPKPPKKPKPPVAEAGGIVSSIVAMMADGWLFWGAVAVAGIALGFIVYRNRSKIGSLGSRILSRIRRR